MASSPESCPLLSPSSLFSSRWSRDNLVTPDPARLYTGVVGQRVGVDCLQDLLAAVGQRRGAFEVISGGLGVLSWNVRCRDADGLFLLQLPLLVDGSGKDGRRKERVPSRCFDNAQHFVKSGLRRYLASPEQRFELPHPDFKQPLVGASFRLANAVPLTFGLGAARVDLVDERGSWVIELGQTLTHQLAVEVIAALSYHYDPHLDGGTAVADVLVNDGDFLVRRDVNGELALSLTGVRRLEPGIEPNRFLQFLVQLIAYEDWSAGDELLGLPVAISTPMTSFMGLERGLALRFFDLGRSEQDGRSEARAWIENFGRSREGRAYRPWVRAFLEGSRSETPDPRKPWWNLVELEERRNLLGLKRGPDAARPLDHLIENLSAVLGVGRAADRLSLNDLGQKEVLGVLEQAGGSEAQIARAVQEWFSGWPYASREQLRSRIGRCLDLSRGLDEMDVGNVLPAEKDGTPDALSFLSVKRPPRVLANPEVFGGTRVEPSLAAVAVNLFPNFESFMDDALHDPRWGYYQNRVRIGRGGHFTTHPEMLSPHFGRWVAKWAFGVWSCLLQKGDISEDDSFPLIELGAGNGRLAKDVLDATAEMSAVDDRWRTFANQLDYRIYELSDSLRDRQSRLLGSAASVVQGDARHPSGALERDFPNGIRGFIVSNELPDAFGVHKVVLSARGDAEATLVVPHLERGLLSHLPSELVSACQATDIELRSTFGAGNGDELLLDRTTWGRVMAQVYELPEETRGRLLDQVWFEEWLVPAGCFPPLAEVLQRGAHHYAQVLAEEDAGVVQYVNCHAANFIQELANSLHCGQIMTIDYGQTTQGLIRGGRQGKFPFRIYCDEGEYRPRPNDPYSRPGGQDLTADINFTDLALAGSEAGLEVSYFGPERALAGEELPAVIQSADMAAPHQKPFAKLVANNVFQLLVLSKDAGFCPDGISSEARPLFDSTLGSESVRFVPPELVESKLRALLK